MTTSADVPGRFPCAIDGHNFVCEAGYERTTVDVIRQQSDASSEPGEQSLSPYGLWRRSQESWHHGAGQSFLDGKDEKAADPHRFRSSKGIDPWTRGEISLLHPTLKAWSTTNTNLYLAVAYDANNGNFMLYAADGNQLYFATLPYSLTNSLALQTGVGWTPTNATITAESQFTLTATSAAAVSATSPTGTSGYPVTPGRSYSFKFSSAYLSGGAGKTPRVNVTWYDAAGATISSTGTVSGSDDTAGGLTTSSAIAPATAAFVSLTLSYTANWASGEVHRVVAATIAPTDTIGTAFADHWISAVIQAGEAAQAIQSIATDGTNIWAALGTSGLHRTLAAAISSTANVPAAPASGQISLVGYANGFLLAAGSAGVSATRKNSLWLVSDPLGTPALSLIKTHPNTSFVWTGIGPGRGCVYAWGNSGGNGEVYKILFDPNTGTLSTAASFATYLPDGETIHALQFYAGGIIMGTGKGVRLGQADGTGNIDYGPLIETDWPVRCLEPQGRWCWFGWTNYPENTVGDVNNSGLGRIDLGYLTDTLTPAWASDLMTPVTLEKGDVVGCVTFAPFGYTANQRPPVRVFTVAGQGVFIEDPGSRVPSGILDTGTIRFSTSEPKTIRSFDIRHHGLPAGAVVRVYLNRDNSNPPPNQFNVALGTSSTTGSYGPATPLTGGNFTVEAMEFRLTLEWPSPNGTDFTRSPEVTRWTAKVLPTPSTIDETFTLTLLMDAQIETNEGESIPLDVPTEVAYIKTLEQARTMVEFQVGSDVFTGYVVKSQFKGRNWVSPARQYSEGTMVVVCQTVRG